MIEAEIRNRAGRTVQQFQKRKHRISNEQDLTFTIGVILVQLHKYSSTWNDAIHLNVVLSDGFVTQESNLNISPSVNQTFKSLTRAVEKEISPIVNLFPLLLKLNVNVHWLSPEDGKNLLRCSINNKDGLDFSDVEFKSNPDSFFKTICSKSPIHFHNIYRQVKEKPLIVLKDIKCFSLKEIDETHAFSYGQYTRSTSKNKLHELFEQGVDLHPNKVAIQYDGHSFTFKEINAKANRLAYLLIRKGIKPGDFIGILLNRTPDAYIAMLGVMKSGAAYIPIDTEYPKERIQFMLEDSSVKCLITGPDLGQKHISFLGPIILMDKGRIKSNGLKSVYSGYSLNPNVLMSSKAPAYVIYTSGSTGAPKGVVISHAAASNLVLTEQKIFKLNSTDRVLQGFSIAFDASVEEIWLAFMSGATLVPAAKELMCSGEDLGAFIEREKISVLSTVPTLLSVMKPELNSLRLIILGGEACPQQLLQRWQRKDLRIVNTYGPTEATVIATYDEFESDRAITIGKPINNCATFIVDEFLNPLPMGVPGELCLAGAGLASGYLNRVELSAEKFLQPTFSILPEFGQRIYRTGDLALLNEAGRIEFLGRIDSQVKLRGYRIELSEVESLLQQYDNIQNAVITVKNDVNGIERLVAYVVLKDTSIFFDEKLCKQFLASRLASYMVPALFMKLPSLPVLPSGKVDRKNLPEPDSCTDMAREIVEPRSIAEQLIYTIWKKYFSPHDVSVTDNFFLDLGGHSLLAARMVSELRFLPQFKNISVVDVYKHPTIERLAKETVERPQSQNGNGHAKKESERYVASRLKHFVCGVIQFISLYFVFGFNVVLGVTGYLAYFYFSLNGASWIESTAWALSSTIAAYPIVILTVIVSKWILLGKIKPGRYKLWGGFYIRWWFVQNLVKAIGFSHFAGTPIVNFLYRLLGVKIGKDVHIDTDHFCAYDLISIGDGSTINEDSKLSGYSVKEGYLNIGFICVGKRCFVGERAVLSEGTIMNDESRLEDLSLLSVNTTIPSGQTWAGSPARFVKVNPLIAEPQTLRPIKKIGINLLYGVLVLILPIVSFISFIPGIAILFQFDPMSEPLTYLAILPVVGATFVILLTMEATLLKWALVGRVKTGRYPVHGSFYIRNWIVEKLLKLSLDYAGQLHATLYVASWYRAMGMKIGRMVELSTAITATPDLVHLSDECTMADEVSLGSPHIERGWMTVAPVTIGRRAFVGNSGVVPSGIQMGNNSLVGVLSIAPNIEDAKLEGATWFGSPSILFPKREASTVFKEAKTYKPPRKLRFARACFELFRITLPPTGFILVTVSMIQFALSMWNTLGMIVTLALLPVVFGVSSVAVILMAAIIKWLVVGRYRPFVKPLWSNFVWRLELVNALYEFLSAPLILQSLQGTPFLTWYLRLLGARIGKHCYIDTTGFLEWDLVEIGDRVCMGEDSVMQTHLFEDRILKGSPLKIEKDCSVGAVSVVLYGTTMHEGSNLDSLSLLMKGEVLPAGTNWLGIPAVKA